MNGRAASWMRTRDGAKAFETLESEPRRILPRRAAGDGRQQVETCHGRVVEVLIGGVIDHAHLVDPRMRRQSLDRMAQQRLAAEGPILLGSLAAEPGPTTGCHDKGDAG